MCTRVITVRGQIAGEEPDMRKNKTLILTILAVAFILAGGHLLYTTYLETDRPYVEKPVDVAELPSTTASVPIATPTPTPTPQPSTTLESTTTQTTTPEPTPEPTPAPKVVNPKFNDLMGRNKDVIGWVSIDDTKIDYEVMYDGTDFYLDHNIDRQKIISGSIYMDPSNSLERSNYNILLHGHHMKNGTMFKDVVKYKEKNFFMKHRIIQFDTLYNDMIWEVFSVYVLNADVETMYTNFRNDAEFLERANSFKDRSMFSIEELELNENDRLLTLSTCSYETSNARTILHARLLSIDGVMVAEPTSDWSPPPSTKAVTGDGQPAN